MIIGLTGSIGCGKTTVLKCFKNFDWLIFNADKECHLLYKDKNFINKLTKRFGSNILINKKINRQKLSEIVFNNKDELKWLNSILHPAILNKFRNYYEQTDNKNLICEIPLLYECDWDKYFDCIVNIWTNENIQYERLLQRGWSNNNIKKRLANQMHANNKFDLADFVLIGNGSINYLNDQCYNLIKTIQ